MRHTAAASAALAFIALTAPAASAGIYTDDLSRCLVSASSDADKTTLIRWIFALITLNPAVQSLSSVTESQRQMFDKEGAELMQRLVLTDCHSQAVAAVKYEGAAAFQASFQVLGQVAAGGLMSHPAVQAGMEGLTKYIDQDKWDSLAKEAGAAGAGGK